MTDSSPTPSPALAERIIARAFAHTMAMIHVANTRGDKRRGDPKVGGHPASCASSTHILGALHLCVRRVHDYVCCKPHAAPLDHAFHHLLGLFRDETREPWWLSEEESKALMHNLRKFPERDGERVLQSYHARSDPDSFHFLPSGSVGIPPVVSVYLALAHRYAGDHGWNVPPKAHFWSLIGDSEFREGSLLECLPDVAERQLGNVTWIVDYNRQNLDGTRIPNERGLRGRDCDRIEHTAAANGWRVIHLRHGALRDGLFRRPGGAALRRAFEGGLSDYEYQMLLFKGDAGEIRRACARVEPDTRKTLGDLSDEEVLRAFADVGGHCTEKMVAALEASRDEPQSPFLIIAHTVKGWGLACAADPANHSTLPGEREIDEILGRAGLTRADPFARFAPDSDEGRFLAERGEAFRTGIREHLRLRLDNRQKVRDAIEADGGLPDSLGIDLSLFPVAHTQWMWGQLAAKLIRIGTRGEQAAPETALARRELNENERRWRGAAQFVLTMSPDVGSSTNISPAMDNRIYGPDQENIGEELELKFKHPELTSSDDPWTRHIRFEIAEANCMSAVAAFGKMAHYCGLPFFPIMTVYDFFIKRALDQLYYNLYWGAEFIIVGTPSGVTLSSEGAQHSWKSDIQIPNLVTWEPLFAIEMDWILSDAIRRQMMDRNEGRRGVLIRAVTRGLEQGLLLRLLRRQASFKQADALRAPLKPAGAGDEALEAVDESSLPALSDSEILEATRLASLAGAYHLIDWRGYAGYEPGDNVVNVFTMGAVSTEALAAAQELYQRGIFANVIAVSSPELLLGLLAHQDGYRHLREGLGLSGDLHVFESGPRSEAGLIGLAGRRVPCVAVCDGEAGLLDNIGSIVGLKQITLAVRRFSKCGRPDQVYRYQGLDSDSIVAACGQVLSETALEDLRVAPDVLRRLDSGRARARADWRELWPEPSAE